MNFFKKNTYLFFVMIGIALFSIMPNALAQFDEGASTTVIGIAISKGSATFKAVRSVIFIVGGFGLVVLAFFAIFGKLKWTWFASLAVGLAILAAAGAIIDYATTDDGIGNQTSRFGDTLTGS